MARIVPFRANSALDQMLAEGRATPATADLLDFEPPSRQPGEPLLSDALAKLRRDER